MSSLSCCLCRSIWARAAPGDVPAITAGLHQLWEQAKGELSGQQLMTRTCPAPPIPDMPTIGRDADANGKSYARLRSIHQLLTALTKG